ncbi:MAG: tyrosine--tRNA ligase [Lachnospiraceae bacterium]|nr:tyrosine--tRNA ligase [Lachnospiraceae bacterium]
MNTNETRCTTNGLTDVSESLSGDVLKAEVRRQMRIILKGAETIIGKEDLEAKLERSITTGKPLNVKFGLDPSAPDIHLGHAVPLRKLKQLQDLGHQIIIIIGDFTGRIGDPTGKVKGRKALSSEEVLTNALTYQEQIFHILDKSKTEVRFNGEWLELLRLEDVLKMASTITVARMLERDDFQTRYNNQTPIGLHEFFYPLLQAYDSVEIKADLELGGTDQTFNILMGRSLQKDFGLEPQAALFMPILEGLDGIEKMSKSLGNYIGVKEDAATMFKKVMEVPDNKIARYFELATDILPDDLDILKQQLAEGCNPRDIKLILARTITGLYHSEEDTAQAETFFMQAFTQKGIPDVLDTLPVVVQRGTLQDIITPLVQSGSIKSGSEFRRILTQGGVTLNQQKITDLDTHIKSGDVLKVGKKTFFKLELL